MYFQSKTFGKQNKGYLGAKTPLAPLAALFTKVLLFWMLLKVIPSALEMKSVLNSDSKCKVVQSFRLR